LFLQYTGNTAGNYYPFAADGPIIYSSYLTAANETDFVDNYKSTANKKVARHNKMAGAAISMTINEDLLHDGIIFRYIYKGSISGVGASTLIYFKTAVGMDPHTHFIWIASANDVIDVSFSESPTVTTAGTDKKSDVINLNRMSSNSTSLQKLELDPVISADGTLLDGGFLDTRASHHSTQMVLGANKEYLFRVTSTIGNTDINVKLGFKEMGAA